MFLSNGNLTQIVDRLKLGAVAVKSISKDIKLEKINSVLKLLYQLFLYSIVGGFIKVLVKFLK